MDESSWCYFLYVVIMLLLAPRACPHIANAILDLDAWILDWHGSSFSRRFNAWQGDHLDAIEERAMIEKDRHLLIDKGAGLNEQWASYTGSRWQVLHQAIWDDIHDLDNMWEDNNRLYLDFMKRYRVLEKRRILLAENRKIVIAHERFHSFLEYWLLVISPWFSSYI